MKQGTLFSAAWISAAVLPYGVTGLAIIGALTSALWFPVAYPLGKRYETVRSSGQLAVDGPKQQ